MSSYRQRLTNKAYIERKKREKRDRQQAEQRSAAEEVICKRCGQAGHKDARSRSCPQNKRFNPHETETTAKKSKRKRDDTDTEEGPSNKKRHVPSPPPSPGSSEGSRSTTATIRSSFNISLSKAQKTADIVSRAKGSTSRKKGSANPNAAKTPCPDCVKNKCYDAQKNPHSSRKSKKCPGHLQDIDEYIEANVGKDYRRFIRKHGLDDLIILPEQEKQLLLRLISETVEDYRMVAIKFQLFASYYIRRRLSRNLPLQPIIFNQAFFYACIQKVIGRPVSNDNPNLPRADINELFQEYDQHFFNNHAVIGPGRMVHSNSLASLANSSMQNLVNHVSENYGKALTNYIKIRLKEVMYVPAPQINLLCRFIFNSSINSATGVTWPDTVERTPNNLAIANTLIAACRVSNQPVTLASLTENPGFYLQHMYRLLTYLEAYNNDNIRTFNEVQVQASYQWVKQIIRTSEFFGQNFNRKKTNRLAYLIFRALRDNTDFQNVSRLNENQLNFVMDLLRRTRQQIQNSIAYLDERNENRANIRLQDCFRPEMWVSIKQYKLFTLVPMYSFTRKYVEIDTEHLKSLLRRVRRLTQTQMEILEDNDGNNRHESGTILFSQVYDFDRLRLNLNYNGKQMFTNRVRTDGFGIDFILAGPKSQTADLPALELSDFSQEEIDSRFHLWGVDPGQTYIFTASDGHQNEEHQVKKYSTAEYYTRAGFKKMNRHILNMKNDNEELLEAERAIRSFKTASLQTFVEYIHSVLDNIDTIVAFYDDRFTSLRFLNYIGRQRADAEMVNIFVTGGKKYLKREFHQSGRDIKRNPSKRRKRRRKGKRQKGKGAGKLRKHRLKPFEPDDRIPLVGLGDAAFPVTMRGTTPGLARRLGKVLKKAEEEGLLVTVPVTEFRTSATCSNCLMENGDFLLEGVSLYGVLLCTNQNCNTIWQRDINASRNIHSISYNVIVNGAIPVSFRR